MSALIPRTLTDIDYQAVVDYFNKSNYRRSALGKAEKLAVILGRMRSSLPSNNNKPGIISAFERDRFGELDGSAPFVLDVHCFNSDTTLDAVEYFASFAQRYMIPRVRIVHGRGDVLSSVVCNTIVNMGLDIARAGEGVSWSGRDWDCTVGRLKYGHVDVIDKGGRVDLWPEIQSGRKVSGSAKKISRRRSHKWKGEKKATEGAKTAPLGNGESWGRRG